MVDEYDEKHKQLGRDYYSNPDDTELAIEFSRSLASYMGSRIRTFDPQQLLNSLTDVYQKHSYNGEVAESYLFGIANLLGSSDSMYVSDNIINEMKEILKRFPENGQIKTQCAIGLSFLVKGCADRNDLRGAEYITKELEGLHRACPTSNSVASHYGSALVYMWRLQGYFEKRNTASKLKKLAEQYPNNTLIKEHCKFLQNMSSLSF
jgi:hypothetical protein